jgi:hypothetical protein
MLSHQRDATYWPLPRARLARVLGRLRIAPSGDELERAAVTFFVEVTKDELRKCRIEHRDVMLDFAQAIAARAEAANDMRRTAANDAALAVARSG